MASSCSSQPSTVPSLASLCERKFAHVLGNIRGTIANIKAESRVLDERKAALTVELAAVADSLEEMHRCKKQLEDMEDAMLDDIHGQLGEARGDALERRVESLLHEHDQRGPPPQQSQPLLAEECLEEEQSSPPRSVPKVPTQPLQPALPPQNPTPTAGARSTAGGKKDKDSLKKVNNGRAWTEEHKARKRAAALPADDAQRVALLRRQVVVRGLPAGAFDEAGLADVLNAIYYALPAYGSSAEPACSATDVKLYSGGSYAFVAMRDTALAATAPTLPEVRVDGSTLTITRVFGYEADAADTALPVPAGLDLHATVASARASRSGGGGAASHLSLEMRLYWALRHHKINPRPCEKEVKESISFFKKSEKLLGRRKLVIDCCGSHGLLGALFVAFGRAEEAAVLDLHRPASFDQICAAWKPWLSGGAPCRTGGAAAADAAAAETEAATEAERVRFVTGDFQESLPRLLDGGKLLPSEIAVVACHACSHLTDSIVAMCIARGVDFAVMPCCQRDLQSQGQMAIVAKTLGIKEGEAIDVARMGGILARGYDCRFRTIDASITPVNRLLVGLARVRPELELQRKLVEESSARKMTQIYSRVYEQQKQKPEKA